VTLTSQTKLTENTEYEPKTTEKFSVVFGCLAIPVGSNKVTIYHASW